MESVSELPPTVQDVATKALEEALNPHGLEVFVGVPEWQPYMKTWGFQVTFYPKKEEDASRE